MTNNELYMLRCHDLAKLGAGYVAPNPMVGSVLVHDGRIIGEGYHMQYGHPHAEVNCIQNVPAKDRHLISSSTLFVSLEPCAHYGKTPPCTDLILENKIPKVVIGCVDPFGKVNGKGVSKLKDAGVEVITGVLEQQCQELNKRFFTFHTLMRPYVILKWAESANGQIANADKSRVKISNEYTNRLVHKWRSEEAGIMVGTNTAVEDNPSLNSRWWHGPNPVRLVVDLSLRLPTKLNIFNKQQPTIVFNKIKESQEENLVHIKIKGDGNDVMEIMERCYRQNIVSVLVEGGAQLLQSFIHAKCWDEARVIKNNSLIIDNGLAAPQLKHQQPTGVTTIFSDTLYFYNNTGIF